MCAYAHICYAITFLSFAKRNISCIREHLRIFMHKPYAVFMQQQSFSVRFYLRNAKLKGKPIDKDFSIYCYLNLNGQQHPFKLPRKINARYWDFRQQQVKNMKGALEMNAWLQQLKAELINYFNEHLREPTDTVLAGLTCVLYPSAVAPLAEGFFDIYQRFIDSRKHRRSPLTIRSYETGLRNLRQFEGDTGYGCSFGSINLDFYDRYYAYWLKQDLLNDTIDKRFAQVKVFMKWAFQRGYHENIQFQLFESTRDNHHDIITLTEGELSLFYNVNFKLERLERVRDLFCFAAFTGQRWGDVSRFRIEDLDGNRWRFEMDKGELSKKKLHEVPLIGYAKPAYDIIRKYDGQLPKLTEQKFNLYLKEAAQVAGIIEPVTIKRYSGNREVIRTGPKWQFLSSHCARRTCATILMNKGVAVAKVKELLGHSEIKTTMKYKNERDSRVADALEEVGELMVRRA